MIELLYITGHEAKDHPTRHAHLDQKQSRKKLQIPKSTSTAIPFTPQARSEEMIMKRLISFLLVIIVFTIGLSSAAASSTTLQYGLKWYMSKEDVLDLLKKSGIEESNIVDHYDSKEHLESLYELIPQEKENRQIWNLIVNNVTYGIEDEEVRLVLCGTEKTGLYNAIYRMYIHYSDETVFYNRLNELIGQLEDAYGKSTVLKNEWENRESAKKNDVIYACYINVSGTNNTENPQTQDEATIILLQVDKDNEKYCIHFEFRAHDMMDIAESLADGSFYH